MRIPLASSVQGVPPSRIRELADLALALPDVLRLHFGESNLPTPEFIKEAAKQALDDGYTFYTENAGLLSLRKALARKYLDLHRVTLDPTSEIVVTASGVQALHLAIRLALNPGDEALVLTPAWPNGSAIVRMCSAEPREIPLLLAGKHYVIDYDALESTVTDKAKLLVYTSPSNPLGWVATPDDQERLLDFARRHRLWLLADEVYERICYRASVAPSILRKCSRDDAVLVVQSFSKSYCMTGWRLGWLVGRNDAARKATQLNEFVVSHAPSMAQKAGEAALLKGEPEIFSMLQRYRVQLEFCRQSLSSIKAIELPEPEGAFYLFPRIQGLADSFSFCESLLREKRVSLAPGVAFGAGGEGSVRICYAADRSVLEPALSRLAEFLEARKSRLEDLA